MIESETLVAAALPTPPLPFAGPDLFASARAANAIRHTLSADRCVFSRSRRLLPTGAWHGPKDAADAYVEDVDVPALGGLEAAMNAGVRAWVGSNLSQLAQAHALGLRSFLRVAYHAGEEAGARLEKLAQVKNAESLITAAVVPTPTDEPMGLDTLAFFAQCRLQLPSVALAADFSRLGHRLAQMALGFGANELFGPIVAERALRVGENANNPALTRKEAAVFIKGASLVPFERLAGGRLEEVTI